MQVKVFTCSGSDKIQMAYCKPSVVRTPLLLMYVPYKMLREFLVGVLQCRSKSSIHSKVTGKHTNFAFTTFKDLV